MKRYPSTWIVQVNRSILGPVVPQGRPQGGKFRPHHKLPRPVREFLNLPEDVTARPVMRDFTTLEQLDTLILGEELLRRTVRPHGLLLTIKIPDSAWPERQRPRPRVPSGVPAIRSLRQLCDHFNASAPRTLNRRVYKETKCGASISLLLMDGTWLHNGDRRLETLEISTPIDGFTIQTIVEGSEATVDSDTFYLPVAISEVTAWIEDMETTADNLWQEAN